jgi:hypothetical protein
MLIGVFRKKETLSEEFMLIEESLLKGEFIRKELLPSVALSVESETKIFGATLSGDIFSKNF